jgi:hypothetical protein
MKPGSARLGCTVILLLFIFSHVFVVGCNDPSRTTGTMLEESDQAKEHRGKKIEKMLERKKAEASAKKSKGPRRQ